MNAMADHASDRPSRQTTVRLFLCGDVMTGRGIDQVLAHPCEPALHESYAQSAMDYVRLAEEANGPVPRQVGPSYVWGAALEELSRMRPDARIINLETSITRSEDFVPKGINYRMSPENAGCLVAAGVDCCVLANNHVLDWGRAGLLDTLAALERLHIEVAGAGRNLEEARAPAISSIADMSRVLVFSCAAATSGVPRSWAATRDSPGVNLLPDLSEDTITRMSEEIARVRQPRDVVIVSIHWGSNWGYDVPGAHRRFAHALVDHADVSVIHGHSSHHAKAAEVYRDRLVLYGCGDFLNDYEGIRGHEGYRDDLPLMYFADIDPATGGLAALEIVPLQIRQFRLARPPRRDIDWLRAMLDRECGQFGVRLALTAEGRFALARASRPDTAGRVSPKTGS